MTLCIINFFSSAKVFFSYGNKSQYHRTTKPSCCMWHFRHAQTLSDWVAFSTYNTVKGPDNVRTKSSLAHLLYVHSSIWLVKPNSIISHKDDSTGAMKFSQDLVKEKFAFNLPFHSLKSPLHGKNIGTNINSKSSLSE